MNRNNEARFSQIPKMGTSRSRFKRKQNVKFTMDAGKLIPFYVDEVLPGDTFSVDTAGICRMATPIYPVMDNCYLDIYYFYVPMRIVWDQTKEFFGENNNTAWTQTTEYTIPQLDIQPNKQLSDKIPLENSLLDYFGVPTKTVSMGSGYYSINALPLRAYTKIWNEWFRDQNVDNPAVMLTSDEKRNYYDKVDMTKDEMLEYAVLGARPLWVNKFHDYFTSALPSPQKGEPTLIPIDVSGTYPLHGYASSKEPFGDPLSQALIMDENGSTHTYITAQGKNNAVQVRGADGGQGKTNFFLATDIEGAVTSTTINNLRQAFAVQQFMEADARGGTRYREIIANHFGVYIDDKTVQIPEYLGGQRYMINVSQVVQTSATDTTSPQGNAAAISVTPFKENSFTKSFQEHGYVIGVCCIRNDNTYQQGLERMWSRTEKYDFYWPEFAHLGEQAVLNKEIYVQGNEDDNKAFGYQEAYAEYRYKPNRVAGKFRSNADQPLDAWHYADNYSSLPTLSQDWLATDSSIIARTLAVQNQPQFICDFLVENDSVRPMPVYGTPGLTKL